MSKLKLLYVVEAMGGGVFTYIVDLSNALADDFDITIAYATRDQTPANFRDYFDPRISLIRVEHFVRPISPKNDIQAFFELKKIVKNVQPDIIHLHSSKAGVLGRFAYNGHKTPMFYTPHGYSFLMNNYGSAKRRFYKAIEAISAKRCCTTISCSKGEYEETLRLTKRATYVNNGINIDELQNLINSIKVDQDHPFSVYTLGRINYQKNPHLFNEIALQMPDVHFIWIGEGGLRDELTAPNIEITGWLERKEALKISLQADCFILTSLWEGLPISLLESMYMKKPCIVSDVIGNHDVIKNCKNGFVCKSLSDFVNAILKVRNTVDTKIIDAAYQDIISEYNTDTMASKYKKIYQEYYEANKK